MRQIPIVRAEPGMVLARDIAGARGNLLLKAGTQLNTNFIDKLKQYGVMRLLIEDENTDDIEVPVAVSLEMQLKALDAAQTLLSRGSVPDRHMVRKVEESVEGLVADLSATQGTLAHLYNLYTTEDAVFFHAVNTSVLALTLGLALRANPQRMRNLGTAALLHDLGLARVPPEVLERGLNMTPEERLEFRRHPVYGFALLQNTDGISSVAARAVLQHHEWVNGRGYPRGLIGDQIVDIAKVVSVADYYDAHVSPQWYRPPVLPHVAVETMLALTDTRFERQVVELFLRRVAIYPIGISVRLNTGETGVVARLHEGLPMRPVVRVMLEADGSRPSPPYDVDLGAKPLVQVAAVVEM